MYATYIRRRTQIYLDEAQDRALALKAEAEGRTKSALIREAIDAYLSARPPASLALRRFRTVLREAAGAEPDLPTGAEYVEELRAADADRSRGLGRT